MTRGLLRAAALAAALAGAASGCAAGSMASLAFCDRMQPMTARQQDRLLQVAAIVRRELDSAGASAALVARSGTDLRRLGIRYSHTGVSLRDSPHGPWAVRQLYYACAEGRPRIFDQGLAGFLFGIDDPEAGYLSILLLPEDKAHPLARRARDDAHALQLLGPGYSANAHPYSLRHQNCNQWVAELLAAAWGDLPVDVDLRARAQAWLAAEGYLPEPVQLGSHLLLLAGHFIPWVHFDDHPEDDRFALRVRTSLPRSIEAFVRAQVPGTQRLEICHNGQQVVVRRGWTPVAEGCIPEAGDRVVALD